jgi:hypothetical protein
VALGDHTFHVCSLFSTQNSEVDEPRIHSRNEENKKKALGGLEELMGREERNICAEPLYLDSRSRVAIKANRERGFCHLRPQRLLQWIGSTGSVVDLVLHFVSFAFAILSTCRSRCGAGRPSLHTSSSFRCSPHVLVCVLKCVRSSVLSAF